MLMRWLSMRMQSSKANAFSASLPFALAGSGTRVCAVIGWPGQMGQTSFAACEHEVELRRIGFRELTPRFRAQARDVVMHLAQQIERERIDRAGRLAAGAIGAKFSSPFSISLGYDRARRVASAEQQYVQGFDGALGLHEVSSSFVACSLRSCGLVEQYSVTIDRNSDSSPRQTN